MAKARQYYCCISEIPNHYLRLCAIVKRLIGDKDVSGRVPLFSWGRRTLTIKDEMSKYVEHWKPKRLELIAFMAYIYQHEHQLFVALPDYEFVFENGTDSDGGYSKLESSVLDFRGLQKELDNEWGAYKCRFCPALRRKTVTENSLLRLAESAAETMAAMAGGALVGPAASGGAEDIAKKIERVTLEKKSLSVGLKRSPRARDDDNDHDNVEDKRDALCGRDSGIGSDGGTGGGCDGEGELHRALKCSHYAQTFSSTWSFERNEFKKARKSSSSSSCSSSSSSSFAQASLGGDGIGGVVVKKDPVSVYDAGESVVGSVWQPWK